MQIQGRLTRKILAGFLLSLIAIGCLGLCLLVVIHIHPPLGVWLLGAFQRQYAMCGASDFYSGARERVRLNEERGIVGHESRLLRTDGPYQLWETPHAQYWIPRGNENALHMIVAQQMVGLYDVAGSGARKGDVVLDCGAHVGIYTREVLKRGARKVIAIEPAPANVECFRRNFPQELASGRVVLLAAGVWDRDDALPLYENPANTSGDAFVAPDPHQRQVGQIPLTTIDEIVARLNLERVDVIKMDIKGATERALRGAAGTIQRFEPLVVVSTEEKEDPPDLLVALMRRLQPRYRVRCGVCSVEGRVVHPDVLAFIP
ncbi:MAG TPA: FkbM family methyltransferase [Bryobacterales bacterium]|nr:FkbM family methyltransferase [Bryobacterales bacterium]